MRHKSKITKIGLDLDGIIIDKPPLIPKQLIEWLYKGKQPDGLHYKFPGKFEQKIRLLSHLPFLRPPITKNINYIKKLSQKKHIRLYAISSRYQFLEQITHNWLKKHFPKKVFQKIYLNTNNQQPHIFKEKVLKKLQPNIFIDDDNSIVKHLQKTNLETKIFYVNKDNAIKTIESVQSQLTPCIYIPDQLI